MQGVQRQPVTTEALVAVSRQLLVSGGPQAVVVREVARRLGVSAPALYKHVPGRDGLLTLLIAACYDEASDAVEAATACCAPTDHEARLRAATLAFRDWAQAHPVEFGLVYGTPVPGYAAPEGGPTDAASRRFGGLFAACFGGLLATGRLRTVPDEQLDPGLRADLEAAAAGLGLPVRAGEAYPFVTGWARMLGLLSVEVAGHLQWAMADTGAFVVAELEVLLDDLVLTR